MENKCPTHNGDFKLRSCRITFIISGNASVNSCIFFTLHIQDLQSSIRVHCLPVIKWQLPAIFFPGNTGNWISSHWTSNKHGLSSHNFHSFHGSDKRCSKHIQPADMIDGAHFGTGRTLVDASMFGTNLTEILKKMRMRKLEMHLFKLWKSSVHVFV